MIFLFCSGLVGARERGGVTCGVCAVREPVACGLVSENRRVSVATNKSRIRDDDDGNAAWDNRYEE